MYYFLDVDGVLNKEQDWRKPFTVNESCLNCFKELISRDKDANIILSSTWRTGLAVTGAMMDKDTPLNEYMKKWGLTIEGITPITNKTRQDEIEYYIRRNGVTKYIILDDDRSLFPRETELNIYFTNYKTGLTSYDVKQILKMIKKMK